MWAATETLYLALDASALPHGYMLWQWLRRQCRRRWPVLPPFGLDPGPDPEPACASPQQAAQPKRQWIVTGFSGP